MAKPEKFSIRMKFSYGDEVHAMVISSEDTWKSVVQSIHSRLDDASEEYLLFYFEDQQEHNEKTALRDDADWAYAISTVFATMRRHSEGRLRIVCEEKSFDRDYLA